MTTNAKPANKAAVKKRPVVMKKAAATKSAAKPGKPTVGQDATKKTPVPTWGGPGRGGGRRVLDASGKRLHIHQYAISIPQKDRDALTEFGEGSLSVGVRAMIVKVKTLKEVPKPSKEETPKGLHRACKKFGLSIDVDARAWLSKFGSGALSAGVRRLAALIETGAPVLG